MKLWIKTLLMLGSIILVTAIAAGGYTLTVLNSTTKAFKMTYTNAGNEKTKQVIQATEPLTILLMGVDTGGEGRGTSDSWNGNSDSQILMTLNPKTHTTTMVSIERDTMTNILDADGNIVSKQKMNAAYPLGYNSGSSSDGLKNAVSYAMKTIGAQTGINIDSFATVNFDGLVNMVDNVGGIDINNTTGQTLYISDTEPQYTAKVPPGKQHINGDQALVYTRDRHHLPNGDYGRAAHQREVIAALMKKILALDNITRYEQFLNEASKDFRTNIPINASTITSLLGYKDCFNKVVSIQYEGVGEMVDGASYQFMPTDIYLAMQNIMKKSLDESTVTTLPSSLITYESVFGSGTAPFYYLPSATVTEKGKATVTYGVDTQGNLVSLNSKNSGNYVSTSGGSVQSDSSSDSSSSASDSTATSSSDSTYQQDSTYNDGYNNSNDSTTSSYGTDDTNTSNYGYGTSQ
ncbi:LCP family protein [Lactococcus lactis]|uniref:LCP family protein n=1 Tax=Lactococcus lactis TaxID=1358 RepID=UPI0024187493|nr:LCP family protein [Lactococcus lactis]MDG4964354.1 LCP family protein [Lactococcus lactis]